MRRFLIASAVVLAASTAYADGFNLPIWSAPRQQQPLVRYEISVEYPQPVYHYYHYDAPRYRPQPIHVYQHYPQYWPTYDMSGRYIGRSLVYPQPYYYGW